MINNKTIMVTGGAGYIGSHVCKSLFLAGYNPVVYDNLVSGHEEFVKWGDFEKGDILDNTRLKAVLKKHEPIAVIHMAALIAAGESVEFPGKYYLNNTCGGLSLLKSMQECGVKNIVFSSTAAVYGIPAKTPIDESFPTNPINPYGSSKLMMEQMLRDFEISDGIKHVALRYFNACGADAEGEIGCNHEKPGNLIPILMDVQSGKKKKIEIFGTDYNTEDGTAIRDYIHVSDLAKAHVDSLNYLLEGGKSATLNLGTGKGHSVMEVINSVNKITGKAVPSVQAKRRAGDPPELIADASKANRLLGWQAEYNNIDDIIETAWNWQKKRLHI